MSQIIDPYIEIEVIGIPADNCKRRTKTIMDNGKALYWNTTTRCVLWSSTVVGEGGGGKGESGSSN